MEVALWHPLLVYLPRFRLTPEGDGLQGALSAYALGNSHRALTGGW